MTIQIITVRVSIKKFGANGYVFDIDTKTPILFGLTDAMKDLVTKDLISAGVDIGIIEQAIIDYDGQSATHFGQLSKTMSIGTYFESAALLGGGGTGGGPGKPSPFDVSLSSDGTTVNPNPCYLLYICEMDNWYFRAGNTKNEILEHVPPIKPYQHGKEPSKLMGTYPTADPKARPKIFGVYVKDSGFGSHPDDPSFNGFNFNIHMAVKQANLHETLITIDPKIRNP